ncbi:unnamed protein product, partial [Protopolystoma xenopodis]
CSIESLSRRHFSQASDVWSWAVTLWEIWTGGAQPWPDISSSKALLEALQAGRRLAWPRLACPRNLYHLMLACWAEDAKSRPTFAYLKDRLDTIRPVDVIAKQNLDEADRLGIEAGDCIIVLDGRPENFWWRGQNRRTGEVGSFPRGLVDLGRNLSGHDISAPLPESFSHTGHLDTHGLSWGKPDILDP